MTIAALARPEIRELRGYKSTDSSDFKIKLHANESPLSISANLAEGLNRYPALRPASLTEQMAEFYGVAVDCVLPTRGSSEGIDLVMRTFCSAGQDDIVIAPPAFEMYQVYATIQGAGVICVPLQAENEFALDANALLEACTENTKLIFLCSPNNPSGSVIRREQIQQILDARAGKSIIIVDEAYIEFSDTESVVSLVSSYENLLVLRTMSKAFALAGARCGAVIASAELISLLDGVLPPYALPSPVVSAAELALSDDHLARAEVAIRNTVEERERLRSELEECVAVERTWPSHAKFLLVRFQNLTKAKRRIEDASIVVRIFENDPQLANCARITVGLDIENDFLINAIRSIN